ncbi:phosphate signaling complex protein PhoU [Paraoerskovia marina]|uniref:Phosphate-specific transport system accessory protein PhoU n=1 Tax=Paraoerskovia marina TaxID=545619 RepID=A0A1H1PZK5_9CELL|nr:phosphate signaling complex protein PhoU [Paraoerskovia marina]SDS16556.1 phosphate uptake regulator, PhoU [Paraoerskovia marina]
MREIFEAELQQVGDDLQEMSALVAEAIDRAGRALIDADHQLAQEVIVDDLAIDTIERALDERCLYILAQQAPVATDLRIVVTALRMSSTLERMGDLARHIAQIARGRYPDRAVPVLEPTLREMHEAATRAARRVQGLLENRDLELAAQVKADDAILDQLHRQTFTTMLDEGWTEDAQQTIDATLLSRFYERFGDHAVSIARRIEFLVTGELESAAHSHHDN